jgi:hypothetical protein
MPILLNDGEVRNVPTPKHVITTPKEGRNISPFIPKNASYKLHGIVTRRQVDLSQCEHWIFVFGLFVMAVFGFRRSLILHGHAWSFCSWCV